MGDTYNNIYNETDNTFDIHEKVDFLYKNLLNTLATDSNNSIAIEQQTASVNKLTSNDYVFGTNIFLDTIPTGSDISKSSALCTENPVVNIDLSLSDIQDFNGSIKDNTSRTIRHYKYVKMTQAIPGDNKVWNLVDASGENHLQDTIPNNYNIGFLNSYTYEILLRSESTESNYFNKAHILDIKNGLLTFYDTPKDFGDLDINTSNRPIISFTRYIGRKGTSKLQASDISGLDQLTSSGISPGSDASLNNLTISGNLITSGDGKIPVSKNTFAIKDASSGELNSNFIDISNTWIYPTNYTISNELMSLNSAVRLEFKINYVTSREYDQLISFKVDKKNSESPDSSYDLVFQDISLGSNTGITSRGVYNGTYIDIEAGYPKPQYRLGFQISTIPGETSEIDISSGILGKDIGYYNYIYMQELYKDQN